MTAVALESGYWNSLGEGVGAIILYAIVGLALMLVGFYAIDLTTPGKLRKLVAEESPTPSSSPPPAWSAWPSSWFWPPTPRRANCPRA